MFQDDLFRDEHRDDSQLPVPDAELYYYPDFLSQSQADHYLQTLRTTLRWRQDDIKIYGRKVKIPRLQAWYGEENVAYEYSGLALVPHIWTPELEDLRQRCMQQAQTFFNSVLANWYRDGQDSVGWHSDDEPELGQEPVIASLSFGCVRDFELRHKGTGEKFRLPLQHGSLLIMAGAIQRCWQHAISKSAKVSTDRINLTFRHIKDEL